MSEFEIVKSEYNALDEQGNYKTHYFKTSADLIVGLLDFVYPVGSLYWSKNATEPSTLFGGTWVRVKDKFILSAGDNYTVGAIGGEARHTLTVDEMPSHNHSGSAVSAGDHTHKFRAHSGSLSGQPMFYESARNNNSAYAEQPWITNAGTHSHTVSIGNTGDGTAHNNMPPYVTYYCWERTA
jgi:hypothetical protein